jgi:Arc/MetJ family transcription regulator
MRTTVALDDDLVARAQALTGLREKSSLVREALKALIETGERTALGAYWRQRTRHRGAAEEVARAYVEAAASLRSSVTSSPPSERASHR